MEDDEGEDLDPRARARGSIVALVNKTLLSARESSISKEAVSSSSPSSTASSTSSASLSVQGLVSSSNSDQLKSVDSPVGPKGEYCTPGQ